MGDLDKGLPVVFSQRVLDGADGILGTQTFPMGNQFLGSVGKVGFWQGIGFVRHGFVGRLGNWICPLGSGSVNSQHKILLRHKSCAVDCLHQQSKCLIFRTEVWSKSTFIAHRGAKTLFF